MSLSVLWSVLTSRLAGPVAAAMSVVLAGCLIAALLGKAVETGRADRLGAERDAWKAAAARSRPAVEQSEALRNREGEAARIALAAAGSACEARVAAARRSARAIQTIVQQEIPHDANGCPARGLVPVERLRDALAPAG